MEKCLAELFGLYRWRCSLICPRCGSSRVIKNGRLHRGRGFWRHLCRACGRAFNDKTRTMLHYSRFSLEELTPASIPLPCMSVRAVSRLTFSSYRY